MNINPLTSVTVYCIYFLKYSCTLGDLLLNSSRWTIETIVKYMHYVDIIHVQQKDQTMRPWVRTPNSMRRDVLFGNCLLLRFSVLVFSITPKSMIVIIDGGVGYYPFEVS